MLERMRCEVVEEGLLYGVRSWSCWVVSKVIADFSQIIMDVSNIMKIICKSMGQKGSFW